jgi:hypothetical protein
VIERHAQQLGGGKTLLDGQGEKVRQMLAAGRAQLRAEQPP